jgi:hypothetical protein
MKEVKPVKTFVIRHKKTKELWHASSGKTSWKQPSHAKLAWGNSFYSVRDLPEIKPFVVKDRWGYGSCKFDTQDVYEIVEVKPVVQTSFEEATALLQRCLGRLRNNDLEDEIKEFLEENE